MTSRTRNRAQTSLVNGRYRSDFRLPWTYLSDYRGWSQETSDEVGDYHEDNPFFMERIDEEWPTLDGKSPYWAYAECEDKPISYRPIPLHPKTVYGNLTSTALDNYASLLLAKSNPNVSHISLATFVGELKDWLPHGSPAKWVSNWKSALSSIPRTLMDRARQLLRRSSSAYVSYRWGVKPLLSDLNSMSTLQEALLRRLLWLRRLRDENELRRTMVLKKDRSDGAWGAPFAVNSNPFYTTALQKRFSYQKVWGSVTWKVDPSFVFPDDIERDALGFTALDRLAYDLTLGLNGYEFIKTVWELTPWSWFIDWFANVGNLIDACNNRVPVTPGRMCIMRSMSLRDDRMINSHPAWLAVKGKYYTEVVSKERHVVSVPIVPFNVALPIFDGSKWSILGALGGSRIRR